MKRILFYTDTPLLGGAENQMYLLAKFLPRDKFSVTLACSGYQQLNPWCQKFLDLDINVVRFKVFHKHDPRHYLFLRKILPQFDLLHLHAWNPACGRYAYLAAAKTPIVVTEHDPFTLKGIKGWIKEKLIHRAKRIIVCSRGAEQLMLGQSPGIAEKIRLVPNGIDLDEWREKLKIPSRADFRRIHFGTVKNEKIILCVAELHERKGQKFLIEAVRKLKPKFPNIKLVFIGDGPLRNRYEKMSRSLKDSVLFLGQRKDIAGFMAAADIFVLPSIREAFGLVLLEAAASELPVIATHVGGIPEIIEDSKTGLLVPPGDGESLAEAIQKLIEHPSEGNALSHHAHDRVERFFHAKTMAEKTAGVYDEVLGL